MKAITREQLLAGTYQEVVFAGGGNRCWWQPVWWSWRGIATAFAMRRLGEALAAAIERFGQTPRNIEWHELLKGRRPFMLPRIYPDWIASYLDASDYSRLRQGVPKIDVVITRPIRLHVMLSTSLALDLYAGEKFWLKNVHARVPHHLGFRAAYLALGQSADFDEARTWLLASGAAVPITPTHLVRWRVALDGGFYDSMPLPQESDLERTTLVLLARHRPDLPQIFLHQGRTYLQPKQKVVAINMDCTSPGNVQKTYDQGRREGAKLLA